MNGITFRVLRDFPEPDFAALADEAFSDYEESALLSEVSAEEAASRSGAMPVTAEAAIRIGAFRGDKLVGRSLWPAGPAHLLGGREATHPLPEPRQTHPARPAKMTLAAQGERRGV